MHAAPARKMRTADRRWRMLRSALLPAFCACWLAGCTFSLGLTNSPPAPNAGSGPSAERR
jgi:hypothetical protein